MSVQGLIDDALAAGLKVSTDGDQLVIRGPKTAAAVAKALLERKADVLRLLQGDASDHEPTPSIKQPAPPPGAVFHYQNEHGQPCRPDASCYMWTWEGGDRWYHTRDYPIPGR